MIRVIPTRPIGAIGAVRFAEGVLCDENGQRFRYRRRDPSTKKKVQISNARSDLTKALKPRKTSSSRDLEDPDSEEKRAPSSGYFSVSPTGERKTEADDGL